MSTYATIEDAIATLITASTTAPAVPPAEPVVTPSPFRTDRVAVYGSQMTDAEVLEEVERMKANAPAALVYYAGGESNGNVGNVCDEEAVFHVVVVAAGTSKTAVHRATNVGLYDLLELVRRRVNGAISGNELVWKGNRRLPQEGRPPTASAMIAEFGVRINHGM